MLPRSVWSGPLSVFTASCLSWRSCCCHDTRCRTIGWLCRVTPCGLIALFCSRVADTLRHSVASLKVISAVLLVTNSLQFVSGGPRLHFGQNAPSSVLPYLQPHVCRFPIPVWMLQNRLIHVWSSHAQWWLSINTTNKQGFEAHLFEG